MALIFVSQEPTFLYWGKGQLSWKFTPGADKQRADWGSKDTADARSVRSRQLLARLPLKSGTQRRNVIKNAPLPSKRHAPFAIISSRRTPKSRHFSTILLLGVLTPDSSRRQKEFFAACQAVQPLCSDLSGQEGSRLFHAERRVRRSYTPVLQFPGRLPLISQLLML